jgi:hypothetical protein
MPDNQNSSVTEADFKPNYSAQCICCGQVPTVDIYVEGKRRSRTEMCGPCTWGEADTIDPENW